MVATKEQEREALKKIRKIVDALGDGSYLATAFEGCFEDAEENIENDFGCSWKQRAESLEAKLSGAEEQIDELNRQVNKFREDRDCWCEKYAELQKKVLSPSDMSEFLMLVRDKIGELEAEIEEAGTCIINCAEEPDNEEFKFAVAKHRDAVSKKDGYGNLMTRIAMIINSEV